MNAPIIRCGLIEQGNGHWKYHALRSDDTAACSSYIPVVVQPFCAASISTADRCKSPACQKLFAEADRQAISHCAEVQS